MFADFGISTATSKYVAEYNVTDKEKLKSVLFNSGIIILGLTIIISLITIFFGKIYLGDKYVYVLYLLPLIFLVPMTSLYDGIYRGLKKFKHLSIVSIIVGLFSLSFVYILIKQYGLTGALIAQNLFYFILFLALAFGYREFHFKLNKSAMKEVGIYSFMFGMAILGYYLFSRVGVIILGYFGYIVEISTYELLNKIFMMLILPFSMLGQVVAPNFAVLSAKKDYKKIYFKLKKYTMIFFIISIFLGILLYLVLPPIFKLFFPGYYNKLFFSFFPFLLLIFIITISTHTIDVGLIVPTGYAYIMSYLYIPLGILNIILAIIFIKYLGALGVIYASLIANLIMVFSIRFWYFVKIYKLANSSLK